MPRVEVWISETAKDASNMQQVRTAILYKITLAIAAVGLLTAGATIFVSRYDGSPIIFDRLSQQTGNQGDTLEVVSANHGRAPADWQTVLKNVETQNLNEGSDTTLFLTESAQSVNADTKTNRLARTFFSEYLSHKKAGTPFTDDELRSLAEGFTDPSETTLPLITLKDVTISENSSEAIRRYGNSIGTAIQINTLAGERESETEILQRAIQGGAGESELDKLTARAKRYEALAAAIKKIPAPPSLTSAHVDLINSLLILGKSTAEMRFAMSDPARAVSFASSYSSGVELLVSATGEIASKMTQSGISFASSEPGATFLKPLAP